MNFNTVALIKKTRNKTALSSDEIKYLVDGFSTGSIPDYQISAWLMAVFLNSISVEETNTLTQLMAHSGKMIDWRKISPAYRDAHIVDKHSSGGIGDKVSFILIGLCTAMGMKIPMMGGRGLGHTGGTIDKLESVPGFTTELGFNDLERLFSEVGSYIMGQTQDICPADKKLYSLRDVTGTVESLPLITASIVSKKLAEGLDAIVYDVKCGSAAFMESLAEARALAQSLVRVTQKSGVKAKALITRMQAPLGAYVGNSLEVRESLNILGNEYPSANDRRLAEPLKNLCVQLAAHMAVLSGLGTDMSAMINLAKEKINDGQALQKFKAMVTAQGGKPGWEEKLPQSKNKLVLEAPKNGYLESFHSRGLGLIGIELGMGRKKADDKLNFGVGYKISVAEGDEVFKGQPLLELYHDGTHNEEMLRDELLHCFVLSDSPSQQLNDNLVIEIVEGEQI